MRLVVEITDELHRALKVRAAREGTSISAMVRGLAYEHVTDEELADIGRAVAHMVGKPETPLPPRKPMSDPMVYPLPPADPTLMGTEYNGSRKRLDLTKSAQVKGKMGHG